MEARQTLVQLFADAESGIAQEMERWARKVSLGRCFYEVFKSHPWRDKLRVPFYFELHKELSYLLGQSDVKKREVEQLRQKIAMLACFAVLDSEGRIAPIISAALKNVINKDGGLVPDVLRVNIGGDTKDEKTITQAAKFTRDKLTSGFVDAVAMLLMLDIEIRETAKNEERRVRDERKSDEKIDFLPREDEAIDVKSMVLQSLNVSKILDKVIEEHTNKFRKLEEVMHGQKEQKHVIGSVMNDELFMASTTFDEYIKYKTIAIIHLSVSPVKENYNSILSNPAIQVAATSQKYYQKYMQDMIGELLVEINKQVKLISSQDKRNELQKLVLEQQQIILTEINKLAKNERPDVDEINKAIDEILISTSQAVGSWNRFFRKSNLENLEKGANFFKSTITTMLKTLQKSSAEILEMSFPHAAKGVVIRPRTPPA